MTEPIATPKKFLRVSIPSNKWFYSKHTRSVTLMLTAADFRALLNLPAFTNIPNVAIRILHKALPEDSLFLELSSIDPAPEQPTGAPYDPTTAAPAQNPTGPSETGKNPNLQIASPDDGTGFKPA